MRVKRNPILIIDGREAIPLRAVPWVTNWAVAPDDLARACALQPTTSRKVKIAGFPDQPDAKSYVQVGNRQALQAWEIDDSSVPTVIRPQVMRDTVLARIDSLTQRLKLKEADSEGVAHLDEWRESALALLPAGAFLWLSEFQDWFKQTRPLRLEDLPDYGEYDGDKEDDDRRARLGITDAMTYDEWLERVREPAHINRTPDLDDAQFALVIEGFEDQSLDSERGQATTDIKALAELEDAPTIRLGSGEAAHGISKRELSNALCILPCPWKGQSWNELLADPPKYLVAARTVKGRRGEGGDAQWNPFDLMTILLEKQKLTKQAISRLFTHSPALAPWMQQWTEFLDSMSESERG